MPQAPGSSQQLQVSCGTIGNSTRGTCASAVQKTARKSQTSSWTPTQARPPATSAAATIADAGGRRSRAGSAHAASATGTSQIGAKANRGSGATKNQATSETAAGTSTASIGRRRRARRSSLVASEGTSEASRMSGAITSRSLTRACSQCPSQCQEPKTSSGVLPGQRAHESVQRLWS